MLCQKFQKCVRKNGPFLMFLRQESTIFNVKFSKSIFSTNHHGKLSFFFFIFSSVGPGRVVFEQKLRKINAHQDQKRLTYCRYAKFKCGRIKPFKVPLFNLISELRLLPGLFSFAFSNSDLI